MNHEAFQLFGPAHVVTLAVIAAVSVCLALLARINRLNPLAASIRWTLAVLLLGQEALAFSVSLMAGTWDIRTGLPLHICDLAIFAVGFSLIRHQQIVWELAYFWGLGGTIQAVLTPDLTYAFPHLSFGKFFVAHGCIIVGTVLLAVGYGRPITHASVWRAWGITNAYALFILLFNFLFRTNYLYLSAKPSQPSLLDYLGPWPLYILSLEGVMILSFYFYYLPYHFCRRPKPGSGHSSFFR